MVRFMPKKKFGNLDEMADSLENTTYQRSFKKK